MLIELDKSAVLLKTIFDQVGFDYAHEIEVQKAVDTEIDGLFNAIPDVVDMNPPYSISVAITIHCFCASYLLFI